MCLSERHHLGVINNMFYLDDVADEPNMTFRSRPLNDFEDLPSTTSGLMVSEDSTDNLEDDHHGNVSIFDPAFDSQHSPKEEGPTPDTGETTPVVQITSAKLHELEKAIQQLDEQMSTVCSVSTLTTANSEPNLGVGPHSRQRTSTDPKVTRNRSGTGDSRLTQPSWDDCSSGRSSMVEYAENVHIISADGSLVRTARFPSLTGSQQTECEVAMDDTTPMLG